MEYSSINETYEEIQFLDKVRLKAILSFRALWEHIKILNKIRIAWWYMACKRKKISMGARWLPNVREAHRISITEKVEAPL